MANQHGIIFRILADLFVAFFVTLAFFIVSHSGNGALRLSELLALYFLRRAWLDTESRPQNTYGFTLS